MILLSHVIDHDQKDLERAHGHERLPSHHQALQGMRRCPREGSDHMLLECNTVQPFYNFSTTTEYILAASETVG
jgi:hypothetical protein